MSFGSSSSGSSPITAKDMSYRFESAGKDIGSVLGMPTTQGGGYDFSSLFSGANYKAPDYIANNSTATDAAQMALDANAKLGNTVTSRDVAAGQAGIATSKATPNAASVDANAAQAKFFDPGKYTGMSQGDYAALEQAILAPQLAEIEKYGKEQSAATDQSMADRGIYSSGLAVRAQNDLAGELAQSYADAASNASQQRYALEQADLAGLNNYNISRASQGNTVGTTNAGLANSTAQSNAANSNAMNQFNASQQQANNQFNANAANSGNQYNTSQLNSTNLANSANNLAAQQSNQNFMNSLLGNIYSTNNTNNQNQNAFNLTNAQNQQQSALTGFNTLANLWSGAGGNSTSGGSFNFSL